MLDATGRPADFGDGELFADPDPVPAVRELQAGGVLASVPPHAPRLRRSRQLAREERVADLDEPLATEARFVAAVHDGDRELAQAFHRRDVRLRAAVVEAFEQRTVVDRVAREERAARAVEQADRVGRVPGQVQHLERDVAEVDHVAFDELVVRGARLDGVRVDIEVGGRERARAARREGRSRRR